MLMSSPAVTSIMPLQRLFVRRDFRSFQNLSADDATSSVGAFLEHAQFQVTRTGPRQYYAEQYFQKLGLRRAMNVWVTDQGEGSAVSVEISATLGDTEAAVGLVGAIISLPLALAVGAVSYIDYEQDATALVGSLWNQLGSLDAQRAGGMPREGHRCASCGGLVEVDSRFCKHCGAKITGLTG
jgi:hypothetical protein